MTRQIILAGIDKSVDLCNFECFTISSDAFNPGKSIIMLTSGVREYCTSLVHENPSPFVFKFISHDLFIIVVFPAPTEPKRIILFSLVFTSSKFLLT